MMHQTDIVWCTPNVDSYYRITSAYFRTPFEQIIVIKFNNLSKIYIVCHKNKLVCVCVFCAVALALHQIANHLRTNYRLKYFNIIFKEKISLKDALIGLPFVVDVIVYERRLPLLQNHYPSEQK